MQEQLMTSASEEWYTPQDVLDRVVSTLGWIDLDPCADPGKRVPATTHYTQAENGLIQPWEGRVFMNPPYGRGIGLWIQRFGLFWQDEEAITEAILLVPARTDTDWFQPLWEANRLCFVRGRLKFVSPEGSTNSATFPSVLAYFGSDARQFEACFHDLGHLLAPRGLAADYTLVVGA